jgi:hypothetical protein
VRQESKINKALFTSPSLECIEDAELADAADALDAAIARIPKSVVREVEDETGQVDTGPPPAQQERGLSIEDIFTHSYPKPTSN